MNYQGGSKATRRLWVRNDSAITRHPGGLDRIARALARKSRMREFTVASNLAKVKQG